MTTLPKDELEDLSKEQLEVLEHAFVKDLEAVFDGKQVEFGAHLQGMLFDLWYRAKGVPKGVVQELEELKEHVQGLKQLGSELRLHVRNELVDQFPTLSDQFKSDIVSDIRHDIRNDVSSDLRNGILDEDLALALSRVLQTQGPHTYSMGYVSGNSYYLPEITDPIPFTTPPETPSTPEDTKNLEDKLQEIGAWVPANVNSRDNWVPCLINKETGQVAGVNYPDSSPQMFSPTTVSTYLTYNVNMGRWEFPNPRPPMGGRYGENVRLYIHGQHFDSSRCSWDGNYEIENVVIPGHTENNGSVRAEYTVIDVAY